MLPVENEDEGHLLCHFEGGAIGTIGCSRIAAGRKLGLCYEVVGSKGTIAFDQGRMSELQYYGTRDPPGRRGFRTLLLGPEHTDYAAFCAAPGHGLGHNDQKIIETRDLVSGITNGSATWPNFRAAYRTDRVLEAVRLSHAERRWVRMAEIQ